MNQQPTGFRELLSSMMKRRWFITAMVLGSFILIIAGVFASISSQTAVGQEWKELLLLMLGAFIGSYGKIIDYWFSESCWLLVHYLYFFKTSLFCFTNFAFLTQSAYCVVVLVLVLRLPYTTILVLLKILS